MELKEASDNAKKREGLLNTPKGKNTAISFIKNNILYKLQFCGLKPTAEIEKMASAWLIIIKQDLIAYNWDDIGQWMDEYIEVYDDYRFPTAGMIHRFFREKGGMNPILKYERYLEKQKEEEERQAYIEEQAKKYDRIHGGENEI